MATGAKMLEPRAVQAGNSGVRKNNSVYRPVRRRDKEDISAKFDGRTGAQELIAHGVDIGLGDMVEHLGGGGLHVNRVFVVGERVLHYA